ncbi:hypothetical protein HDU76_002308 [Blyttiomyces sp. JEL0837]|nr:hypothetical protein HDU76_002308 [Blyttiomyces sp. JEL0837]
MDPEQTTNSDDKDVIAIDNINTNNLNNNTNGNNSNNISAVVDEPKESDKEEQQGEDVQSQQTTQTSDAADQDSPTVIQRSADPVIPIVESADSTDELKISADTVPVKQDLTSPVEKVPSPTTKDPSTSNPPDTDTAMGIDMNATSTSVIPDETKNTQTNATENDTTESNPTQLLTERSASSSALEEAAAAAVAMSRGSEAEYFGGGAASGGSGQSSTMMEVDGGLAAPPGKKPKKSRGSSASKKAQIAEQQRQEQMADMSKTEVSTKKIKIGNVTVVNDERLMVLLEGVEDRCLGHFLYTGARMKDRVSDHASDLELCLLPPFNTSHLYGTMDVRIPAEFLTYNDNLAVKYQCVWGTDIYADDSDIVAALVHSGAYRLIDTPPEMLPEDPANLTPSSSKPPTAQTPTFSNPRKLPSPPSSPLIPKADPSNPSKINPTPLYDLEVTIRILPRLQKYSGTLRNGISSRGWGGSHMGESFRIEKVVEIERGTAGRLGRKRGAREWCGVIVDGERMKRVRLVGGGSGDFENRKVGSGKKVGGNVNGNGNGNLGVLVPPPIVVVGADGGVSVSVTGKDSDSVNASGEVSDAEEGAVVGGRRVLGNRRKTGRSGGRKAVVVNGGGENGVVGKKVVVSGPERTHDRVAVVFSSLGGHACMKYSRSVLIDWPRYWREFIMDYRHSLKYAEMESKYAGQIPSIDPDIIGIPASDLKRMEKWAYWRVRSRKDNLVLENGRGNVCVISALESRPGIERYHLQIKPAAGFSLKSSGVGEKSMDVALNEMVWQDGGLKIVSGVVETVIPADRFYWVPARQ